MKKELINFISKKVTKLAQDIQKNLIESTPVLTGFASASYLVSVGKPSFLPVIFNPTVSIAFVTSNATKASLLLLNNYKINQGDIYITSTVPYLDLLNAGGSPKAPAGFIQAAILKGIK